MNLKDIVSRQSCPSLCYSMDCSPPGSSIHEILQARILVAIVQSSPTEWELGCHSLLQGIFPIQGLNLGLLHCWQILYHLSYREELACPKSLQSCPTLRSYEL